MTSPSSERIPVARPVLPHIDDLNSHRLDGLAMLNGRHSLPHGTEQRAEHIGMRPHSLPPSPGFQPTPDRDSTRVLVMDSGRAGIVFARGPDGKRPPQRLVASLAIAEALVRDYKLAKPFIAFLGWLANMLPRDLAPSGGRPGVAKSGVRVKPSAEVSRTRYGR
jgi:hypothetical protein